MTELNNRIDAQRVILNHVNSVLRNEELYGLSRSAIDRWISVNGIDPKSDLPRAICESADKLFFLANKSQEQVTDEYRLLSVEVLELTQRIARIVEIA
jgi:hypothetical protein